MLTAFPSEPSLYVRYKAYTKHQPLIISDLLRTIDSLRDLQKVNFMKQMFSTASTTAKIKACSVRLDWAVRHFQVQNNIDEALSVFRLLDFAVSASFRLDVRFQFDGSD